MSTKNDSEKYSKIAYDYVEGVCDNIGPRYAGSLEEKSAAEDLERQLKKFSDDTFSEQFEIYPDLYPQGLIKVAIYCAVFSSIFFIFNTPFNLIAVFGGILGIFIVFVSLVLMKEWFGFFFKKAYSQNSIGKIYPRDEKGNKLDGKIKIIMSGHIDSANQMKIIELGDNIAKITAGGFGWIIMTILLGLLKSIIVPLVPSAILAQNSLFTFSYLDLIWIIISIPGIPLVIYLKMAYTGDEVVQGANDNLIGVGIALAIGKYFSEEKNRLKNIELWFGGFGSEECGERGSGHFVKIHGSAGELDNAIAVIPESCGAGSQMAIITYERMHLAHHDKNICNDVYQNGYLKFKEEVGEKEVIPVCVTALPFAASDAGRFSLSGYKATMIISYDGKLMKPSNWHAVTDVPKNLEMKNIKTVIGTISHYIKSLDEELI